MSTLMRVLWGKLGFSLAERLAKRNIRGKLGALEAWQVAAPEEKIRKRLELLKNTLSYAKKHVPYYRDLFERIKFVPEKLEQDIAYLKDIPYLTKEIVMMQPERFLSDEFSRSSLLERKTSGSTGLTLSFYYSRADLDMASAVLRFLDGAAGKTSDESEVYLRFCSPRTERLTMRERFSERGKDLALNRLTLDIAGINPNEAKRCLWTIKQQRPFSIYGLCSTFASLLHLADDPDLCKELCRCYINSGETLEPKTADYISRMVGCKVVNRYGNAEFGAVAQSANDSQSLRFVEGIVFPENFTIEGFHEIVLTTLQSKAMPLIRYRTGDLGEVVSLGNGGCELTNVLGRLHDLVYIGGQPYTTAYFSGRLHDNYAIHDFQIVQDEGGTTEFRIVTDQPEVLPRIASDLSREVGQPVSVSRIRPTDLIRRGRQMKFSHVVKNVEAQ